MSGLMVAVEFVKDRANKMPDAKVRDDVVQAAKLLMGCGENNIGFSPPLIVDENEIDFCLKLI
jgi:4-aminobutyrate aminotransferase-like enzyme